MLGELKQHMAAQAKEKATKKSRGRGKTKG